MNNYKKPNYFSRTSLTNMMIVSALAYVGPWSATSYGADQVVPSSQASKTPQLTGTMIQGPTTEINASAPKADPDPFALPPHAPEFLVKLRGDLEKTYDVQKTLISQMMVYLATADFDVKSQSFLVSAPSAEGEAAIKGNYGDLLMRLEQLNTTIQMKEAEYIQEKEVYLAQGPSAVIQTASAHGTESSTVSFVQGK
jgi:hypothetical protein